MKMDAERVISGFRREVAENCALLDYYAVCSGNSLSTFRDNLSVPYSRVKNLRPTVKFLPLQMEPMGNPENSVWNHNYTLCNSPEEHSYHECGRSLRSV